MGGLDDEDSVALGQGLRRPGGAGNDGVVEGDGDAAAVGEAEFAGEGVEGGVGGELAGGIVKVDTHGEGF